MKKFRDEIYEPEHESGVTCWCKPTVTNKNGEMHITHHEERDKIPALVLSVIEDVEEHASQQDDDAEIAGMLRATQMIKDNLGL